MHGVIFARGDQDPWQGRAHVMAYPLPLEKGRSWQCGGGWGAAKRGRSINRVHLPRWLGAQSAIFFSTNHNNDQQPGDGSVKQLMAIKIALSAHDRASPGRCKMPNV